MRLNFNTGTFPPDQLNQAIHWVSRLKVDGVELSPEHARRMHESADARRSAMDDFKRLGVRPLSLHAWTEVEGLPEVCPFTAEIGAGLIVVHCRDESIRDRWREQVDLLTHWQKWCADRGVILTVENSSIQPLEPFVRLFDAIPPLRMTLDIKHAYKPDRLGLTHVDYLAALGGRLANLHITGINNKKDGLGDGSPPGHDLVDWQELARDLKKRNYNGLATIECSYPSDRELPVIERGYADLPVVMPEGKTISERVAAWCVDYYRRQFASLLQGSAQ